MFPFIYFEFGAGFQTSAQAPEVPLPDEPSHLKGSQFCFSESKNNLPGLAGVTYQSVCMCVCGGGRMVGIKSVIKWEDFSAESC